MRFCWLIGVGIMLSNCAMPFAQGVTARDVISSINGVRNIQKISTPAVREQWENRVKQITRSMGAGAEVQ